MQYVIGIDGGGTKTRMKIADKQGNLLLCCEGGPTNINSKDRVALEKNLTELLNRGLKLIHSEPGDCLALCLGMAGAGRSEEKLILEEMLHKSGFHNNIVTDDVYTALVGGIGCDEGIILLSGTGSICFGRNRRGETRRAGGWGYIIGDEGSGYDIGLQALKHLVKSFDLHEKPSLLSVEVKKRLRLESMDELIHLVYRSGDGHKIIAGLAPAVDEAFEAGDKYAQVILDNAVLALLQITEVVINGLDYSALPIRLSFGGSVILKSKYISDSISDSITCKYPKICIGKVENDAAWGAVQLAKSYLAGRI